MAFFEQAARAKNVVDGHFNGFGGGSFFGHDGFRTQRMRRLEHLK
jgi:hypothetical protein